MILKPVRLSIPSTLAPDTVLARLSACASSPGESALTQSERQAGIIGWKVRARPPRFTIRAKVFARNSFVPHFAGVVDSTPSGSQVEGELRLHWFTRLFMLAWLGATAVAPLVELFEPIPDTSAVERLFVAIFMLVPCGALFAFGLWLVDWGSKESTVAIKELLAAAVRDAGRPQGEISAPGI